MQLSRSKRVRNDFNKIAVCFMLQKVSKHRQVILPHSENNFLGCRKFDAFWRFCDAHPSTQTQKQNRRTYKEVTQALERHQWRQEMPCQQRYNLFPNTFISLQTYKTSTKGHWAVGPRITVLGLYKHAEKVIQVSFKPHRKQARIWMRRQSGEDAGRDTLAFAPPCWWLCWHAEAWWLGWWVGKRPRTFSTTVCIPSTWAWLLHLNAQPIPAFGVTTTANMHQS